MSSVEEMGQLVTDLECPEPEGESLSEVGNFSFDNSEATNLSKFHGFGVLSEL